MDGNNPAEEPSGLRPLDRRKHWILFAALAAAITVLDLASKEVMFRVLEVKVVRGEMGRMTVQAGRPPIVVIPGLFELEANINFGAFSGWFSEHTGFLTVLSAAALLLVAWWLRSQLRGPGPHRLWQTAALGLLWGGTLGNLYDRAVHGYVRDFVKWFFVWEGQAHVWPNFNIADSAICVGVGIILVLILFDSKGSRRPREAVAARS